MAFSLANRSDDEIRLAHNQLRMHPEYFEHNPEYRMAIITEHNRRFSRPANVTRDLEASATPIAVEPVAGTPRPNPTPEELDAAFVAPLRDEDGNPVVGPGGDIGVRTRDSGVYGQVFGDAVRRTVDRGVARRQEARAQGYQDPEQLAYNAETGLLPPSMPRGDTVMVDGVEVPAYRLSDGRPFGGLFREGDLRAAQEAETEARMAEHWGNEAQEEMQRYGDGTVQFYRYDPEAAAAGVRNVDEVSPSERDARFQQIRGRAPTQAERAEYEQQAANLAQRRGMEQRQADQNRMLRQRPGLRELEQQRDWSRNFIRARNLLAGGAQNINSGNVGYWNRLAMLSPGDQMAVAQPGLAQMRADVEKVNLERAAALAARGIQGALAGTAGAPLDAARAEIAMAQAQNDMGVRRRANEDAIGEEYAPYGMFGYNEFTVDEQKQMYDDLRASGYSEQDARAAVARQAMKRRASERWEG